jgi:hypothetical protein
MPKETIYAKRRDAQTVDWDNCKVIGCLVGATSCTTNKRFEEHMRAKGYKVIWVNDLDKTWNERNGN